MASGRPAPKKNPNAHKAAQQTQVTPLQKASAPLLLRLHALPRWIIPVLMAVLLVTGFALEGIAGALCLLVLGLFLGWLVLLSWPLLSPGSKVIRVLVVGVVLAGAYLEAFPPAT